MQRLTKLLIEQGDVVEERHAAAYAMLTLAFTGKTACIWPTSAAEAPSILKHLVFCVWAVAGDPQFWITPWSLISVPNVRIASSSYPNTSSSFAVRTHALHAILSEASHWK